MQRGSDSEGLKLRLTGWVRISLDPSIFAVLVALAIAATLQTACTGCRVGQTQTPSERLEAALKRAEAVKAAEAIKKTEALPKASAGGDPGCPLLGAALAPTTSPPSGGHRVTLSWKASPPADPKHAAASGYCIYRTALGEAQPVLISGMPFPGTSCVDDMVQNGKGYSYEVRAVSASGAPSTVSNPAPVTIPSKPGSAALPLSIPLCRGPVNAK
jgi:hypothetical protein